MEVLTLVPTELGRSSAGVLRSTQQPLGGPPPCRPLRRENGTPRRAWLRPAAERFRIPAISQHSGDLITIGLGGQWCVLPLQAVLLPWLHFSITKIFFGEITPSWNFLQLIRTAGGLTRELAPSVASALRTSVRNTQSFPTAPARKARAISQRQPALR